MIRHHDRDSKSCAIGCFKGRTAEQLKHYCHTRIIIKYSFHIHTFTCRRAFRKCSFCTIWHLILVFFLHFMFIFDLWCYRREKRTLRGHLVWPLRIRMVYVRSEVVLLTFLEYVFLPSSISSIYVWLTPLFLFVAPNYSHISLTNFPDNRTYIPTDQRSENIWDRSVITILSKASSCFSYILSWIEQRRELR